MFALRQLIEAATFISVGALIGLAALSLTQSDRVAGSRLDPVLGRCPGVIVNHVPDFTECSLTIFGQLPDDVSVMCVPRVFH